MQTCTHTHTHSSHAVLQLCPNLPVVRTCTCVAIYSAPHFVLYHSVGSFRIIPLYHVLAHFVSYHYAMCWLISYHTIIPCVGSLCPVLVAESTMGLWELSCAGVGTFLTSLVCANWPSWDSNAVCYMYMCLCCRACIIYTCGRRYTVELP